MCFGEIHVDTILLYGNIVRAKLFHGAMSIEQGMDLIRSFRCSTIDGCHKDRKRRSWGFQIFAFADSMSNEALYICTRFIVYLV
jgi:hypothetical protein